MSLKNIGSGRQGLLYDGGHVVVAVLGQAAAEDYVGLLGGKMAVGVGKGVVAGIVYGVVGFHSGLVLGGVFLADNGLGAVIDLLAEHFKVLVLYDAGVGLVVAGVVDYGIALVVGAVLHAGLEADGAPVKAAQTVTEILIYGAGIDQRIGYVTPAGCIGAAGLGAGRCEEVCIGTALHTVKQAVNQPVVAALWYALIFVVEVVVVIDQTDGQALDDECGQVLAGAAPLFLGIVLYECLVDVAANQQQGLLLKIAGFGYALGLHGGQSLGTLLIDPGLSLRWSGNAPHLIEGVHVERQVVQPSVVVGHRAVGVAVEGHNAVHEIPHLFVVGVEDVGAVLVYVDALYLLAIHVAAQMPAFLQHQHALAALVRAVCEHGSEQARAHNYVIVLSHLSHGIHE